MDLLNPVKQTALIDRPGFYKMSDSDYFSRTEISNSALSLFAKSPLYYRRQIGRDREPTKAMTLGKAIHAAVLEPEVFEATYVKGPDVDRRTSAGKAEFLAFIRVNAGKIALSEDDFELCLNIARAVRSHPVAGHILTKGHAELACFWDTGVDGIKAKAKIDWLSDQWLVDLKSTEDARPESFIKSMVGFRYHVQIGMYLSGVEAVAPELKVRPLIIAVEKECPDHISLFEPDQDMIDEGKRVYRATLERYAECLKTNEWPGYTPVIQELSLPSWYRRAS